MNIAKKTERTRNFSVRYTPSNQIGQLGVAVPFRKARDIVGSATAARLADDRQRRVTNVGQGERAVARYGSRPHERRVVRRPFQ
jgi:hypothetical protein